MSEATKDKSNANAPALDEPRPVLSTFFAFVTAGLVFLISGYVTAGGGQGPWDYRSDAQQFVVDNRGSIVLVMIAFGLALLVLSRVEVRGRLARGLNVLSGAGIVLAWGFGALLVAGIIFGIAGGRI